MTVKRDNMIRKVASSPIITLSEQASNHKSMIHSNATATAAGRHTASSNTNTLHRRQITPDSVVGTNILCSQSFTDECTYSSTTATITSSSSSRQTPHSTSTPSTITNNNNSASLLRPRTSSASSNFTKPDTNQHQQQQQQPNTQLLSILTLESSPPYTLSPHYLHSSHLLPTLGISEKCRRKTCEWMYELCDYFQLHREVVGIALFYVDRYFTIVFGMKGEPVTKREFQLIGLTALYVAIKTHGQCRQCDDASSTHSNNHDGSGSNGIMFNKLKFSLQICASTSREQFTARQIEECECVLLQRLEWRLNPIVPSGCVIEYLILCLPFGRGRVDDDGCSGNCGSSEMVEGGVVQNFVYDCATYLTELAVSVAALSLVYRPSVVAYASILVALDLLLVDESSSSSPSSCCVTKDTLIEYEALLNQASCQHFERNKEDVMKAKQILTVMAPNIGTMFPSPFSDDA